MKQLLIALMMVLLCGAQGCWLLEIPPETGEFIKDNKPLFDVAADLAGTVWPPLKWIILGATTCVAAISTKRQIEKDRK